MKPFSSLRSRLSLRYSSVATSSRGGLYSSGIRNSLAFLLLIPSVARLESTETIGERISEKTIGANHHRKRKSSHAIPPAHTAPNSSCEPCRLKASLHGVSLSSRCGEFQTTSQPRKALTTYTVWNNIRTGASKTENSISSNIYLFSLMPPP